MKQEKVIITRPLGLRILIIAMLLFALLLISSCVALILEFTDTGALATGNVAIIPIEGVITSTGDSWDGAVADDIVDMLERARTDDSIEAVVLEINSPGGSAVASDEIGSAVKKLRTENKTVVAWIREMGASGGYWVASASDHIVANRMSITGSIGVIGSGFGFEEFIDDWNVTYRRLVAGERKDLGTPWRAMTKDEEQFMQAKLDAIHEVFIDEIATNRNMGKEDVRSLATGEFFLGSEAKEAGLVDELGGLDEALAFIEEREDIAAETVWYEPERSWTDLLAGIRAGQDPMKALEQKGTQKIALE